MTMATISPNQERILSFSGVSLGYPGVIAVRDITFSVKKGEFVGIFGPNGSGKSTLLKGLLGLLPVLEGEIDFFSDTHRQVRQFRNRIGYVPQKNKSETNFPARVREVVMMGLYARIGWFRQPNSSHWQQVRRTLELVKMAEFAEDSFGELSGGQQQRVIIARALVANPQLLILDEPTSAVDISAQYDILEILENLNREQGITILMVSHDINEIVHFCDQVLLLNKEMIGFGRPGEVLTKENLHAVYGNRVMVYDHHGHPHILVGDFDV